MGEIILHGDCLVDRAAELQQLFAHYLATGDERVGINMSSTGRCDISFFQLICSVCRSFSEQGRQIVLHDSLPATVLTQFKRAGLLPACSRCEYGRCLFKEAVRELADW